MRRAPMVVLSAEERARLGRWCRVGGRGNSRALRARLVLLAADGRRDIDIAQLLHLDRRTVARWRRRFLAARLRGLADAPGTVVRGRIPEERLQAIVRATVGRSPGPGAVWSTRRLAREFGVSHMTVRRVWDLYDVRPNRRTSGPVRPDPVSPARAWDVVGLYLRPPIAALAVTLRPEPPGSVSSPTAGTDPGATTRPQGPQHRLDDRILSAFRSLRSFDAGAEVSDPIVEEFLRFLGAVQHRLVGRPPVRVVALTPGGERSPTLDRWRVRHPEVDLEILPDFARWQRRAVECVREAGRRDERPSTRRAAAEAARSIARSVAAYREGRGPLVWMATSEEARNGRAAHRLRYDLAVTGQSALKTPESRVAPMSADQTGPDGAARRMARAVLHDYLRVRRGDRVTVETWSGTAPYANALVLEALRVGARPMVLYQDEATYWAASAEVPTRNLGSLGDHRRTALERTDALVSFFGPSDRERFHALPPATRFRLCEFQDALERAAARAGARAVQLAIGRVSAPSARMYNVDEDAWRRELIAGTLVGPSVLRRRGRRLEAVLGSGRELEIRHPNGTHLSLRLRGYAPVGSYGEIARHPRKTGWQLVTLPAGVVAVAVDERSADGTFRSNLPSSVGLSDAVGEMVGARWTFRGGRLASFAYDSGEELFRQSYTRAPAGRDAPSSISIGLNEQLRSSPLLEDQGRGTVTMHLGRNDHLGGRTRCPWWAWAYLTGADVRVDGRTVLRRGQLAA